MYILVHNNQTLTIEGETIKKAIECVHFINKDKNKLQLSYRSCIMSFASLHMLHTCAHMRTSRAYLCVAYIQTKYTNNVVVFSTPITLRKLRCVCLPVFKCSFQMNFVE